MNPRRMALLSLILAATILYAQKPGEPSPEPEPEKPVGPVVLRLVAKKTTYALDRGGMTAEAYKKAIADGSVSAPATATFSTYLYDQQALMVAPGGGKGKGKANPNPVFIGKGMGRITPVTLTSKSIELTVTEKK